MDREPPQPPPGPPGPGGPGPEGPEEAGWPLRGVTPDWADAAEWERMCAARGDEPEPPDPDEEFFTDPDHGAPAQWQYVPAERAAAQAREYAALRARLIAA